MAKRTRSKKTGRPFLSERTSLSNREKEYCVLIPSGTPVEVAAQEIGVIVKEALRWHREHPLLEPYISELREENYQRLSEQTLNQYLHLLTQISDQLQRKIDNGKDISIKELKDAFSLQSEVGTVLRQHEIRKEEANKQAVEKGKGYYVHYADETIFEMAYRNPMPEEIEHAKQSILRWTKKLVKGDKEDLLARLQRECS
jgi:hypothetical protein